MFEKVLICLDGSELAEHILPHIAEEAGSFGAAVLLKVVDTSGINVPLGIPGASGGAIHTAARDKRIARELAEMPDYLEQQAVLLREKGLRVMCVILEGVPSEAIIAYAQDNGIGLIAIATHGHRGLRHVALGSTAEYVLKHGGLPVLLVTPRKSED